MSQKRVLWFISVKIGSERHPCTCRREKKQTIQNKNTKTKQKENKRDRERQRNQTKSKTKNKNLLLFVQRFRLQLD